MKKRAIATLGILATLMIAVGGALTWTARDLVMAYKPEIQQKLSQAVGADVSVGDLSLSILPRTSISLSQVTVKDTVGGAVGLSVGALKAQVALLPLLSRRLQVSSILIDAPCITLHKEATGISVAGLGNRRKAQEPPALERAITAKKHPRSSGLEVTIHSISVRKGQIRFEDATSGKNLEVNDIDIDAGVDVLETGVRVSRSRASLVAPGSQSIRAELDHLTLAPDGTTLVIQGASIESAAGKVSVSGSVSTTTGPGSFQIASTGLELVPLSNLVVPFAPELAGYKPRGSIGMKVDVTLSGTTVQSVEGPITLKDSRFGGDIQALSRLTLGSPMTLAIQPSISSLSLEALLQVVKPDLSKILSGTIVECNADLQNIMLSDPASSLSGPGNLLIKDGVIKGFNIPNQVLSNIDGLPFISGNLRKRVPPDFEQFVATPDTPVKELRARFSLEHGVIKLSEFVLTSDIFTLQSAGTVTLLGQLDLDSEILFSPQFSAALTSKVKEFRTLLDGQQRLVVPLIVQGRAPTIVVVPNIASLVQKATIGTVRKTLGGAVSGGKEVTKSLGKIFEF